MVLVRRSDWFRGLGPELTNTPALRLYALFCTLAHNSCFVLHLRMQLNNALVLRGYMLMGSIGVDNEIKRQIRIQPTLAVMSRKASCWATEAIQS